MSDDANATLTVTFGRSSRPRETITLPPGRVPRVTRHLALAHEIERRVRAGELDDLAQAAREFGLTRARVTQIVSLILLAPAIQEEILAMPAVTNGRDPITERTLRSIVAEPVWERRLAMWNRAVGYPPSSPTYPSERPRSPTGHDRTNLRTHVLVG